MWHAVCPTCHYHPLPTPHTLSVWLLCVWYRESSSYFIIHTDTAICHGGWVIVYSDLTHTHRECVSYNAALSVMDNDCDGGPVRLAALLTCLSGCRQQLKPVFISLPLPLRLSLSRSLSLSPSLSPLSLSLSPSLSGTVCDVCITNQGFIPPLPRVRTTWW